MCARRCIITLTAALTAVLLTTAPLSGATRASAVATVRVTVEPSVQVDAVTPLVDLDYIPVGEFPASIVFRVRSNAPRVAMFVTATPLVRGSAGDAKRDDVPSMPLARGGGITIDSAADAVLHTAQYRAADDDGGELRTEEVSVADAAGLHDTVVTVTWDRSDPAQPQGRYEGRVVLTAMLLPER